VVGHSGLEPHSYALPGVHRVQQVDRLGRPVKTRDASEPSGVEGEAALDVPPTGYTDPR
jgi:hypothetical protein